MTNVAPPFAWNFCPECGAKLEHRNDGESDRPHCAPCGRFFYSNPVPAACCIVARGDEILFVQRAIEPCRGGWSLPGGFVELGETTEEAAVRELWEETRLRVADLQLLGVSTQPSQSAGAVTVLGYLAGSWAGEPEAASDAMAFGFFNAASRPPLAFQVHRELMAIYDAHHAGGA